jgi:Putative auto-transporter adhesin, head GIN domain
MAGMGRMGRSTFGKLNTAALLAAVLTLPSSASAVERKLLVASFENIVVIGDINVTVQTGKSPSAIASGDKRVLESLKLERVGTTLRVRLQDIVNNDKGRPITEPLRVTLTTQGIKNMTLSGNGALTISEVKQQTASRMLIAGNGKITIGRLIADQFSANINGNGKVDIGGGMARDAQVTIDGAGEFQGEKLQMRKLRLEHSGNAVSSATVEEGTDIYNRGSGNITIGGRGTCFIKLAGNAAISCAKIDSSNGK